jgi:Holliday junction DNA helicase RuvA
MIAQLRGTLMHKSAEGCVVDCGGVGYGVALSLMSLEAVGPTGGSVMLFVHTHVTEDALRLYGFVTELERRTFEILLQTAGVGPRLALTVLSTLSPQDLSRAVTHKDRSALTRIPGVGPKKADRLLIELAQAVSPTDDVVSALLHLGFSLEVSQQAARAADTLLPQSQDVAALTRAALQHATRGPKGAVR